MGRLFFMASFLATAMLTNSVTVGQQTAPSEPKPLPMVDGKGQELGLSRRVVSRPGAIIRSFPETGDEVAQPTTFSTHYIFEETEIDGKTYFKVGPPGMPPVGWLSANEALEWPNNVSLVFKVPIERTPVLFFDSLSSAVNFRDLDTRAEQAEELSHLARKSSVDDAMRIETGLNAVEGEAHVDWKTDFYLMPVLAFQDRKNRTRRSPDDMYLKTATVPLMPDGRAKQCGPDPQVAIVFVIDTTKSMGQYIERARETVDKMAETIRREATTQKVSFGLVGFRDDPDYRTGIEYRSKTFQALDPGTDPTAFSNIIDSLETTSTPTEGFSEDALAGLLEALDMDWKPFGSKWIVLITDASPKPEHQDANGQRHTVEAMSKALWDQHNTGLVAIHLQTDEAQQEDDMQAARDRLRALSSWKNVDDAYVAVSKGDLGAFGTEIDQATDTILGHIKKDANQLKKLAVTGSAIDRIGYAQRVIWLGQCQEEAPSIIEGWTMRNAIHPVGTSPDSADKEIAALEPRILLTRQQLDNLVRLLEAVLNAAQQDQQTAETFFQNLRANLTTASIDANHLSMRVQQYRSIEDFFDKEVDEIRDLLPSYLTLVPFRTDMLTMTEDQWVKMQPQSQTRLIETWRSRIDDLKTLYNSSGWVKLHEDSASGEEVMPILTSFLP